MRLHLKVAEKRVELRKIVISFLALLLREVGGGGNKWGAEQEALSTSYKLLL